MYRMGMNGCDECMTLYLCVTKCAPFYDWPYRPCKCS